MDLVSFWQALGDQPPYIHSEDRPVLEAKCEADLAQLAWDFQSFITSPCFGDGHQDRFHFSLLPVPYMGDLARADIFLLQLNPGFGITDYWGEYERPDFRQRLIENLAQRISPDDFPFVYLDPHFCWHGGFNWWEGKLREVLSELARRRHGGRYLGALKELSRCLAALELVPYHSAAFGGGLLTRRLPSSQKTIAFTQEVLAPRAAAGEITVIVTRRIRDWGLPGGPGVVTYEGRERGASLSLRSAGGQAILSRLLAAEEPRAK